jgi:hypothetical protein
MSGVMVKYHAGRTAYVWQNQTVLVVKPASAHC